MAAFSAKPSQCKLPPAAVSAVFFLFIFSAILSFGTLPPRHSVIPALTVRTSEIDNGRIRGVREDMEEEECGSDGVDGRWVFDNSTRPLYSDSGCRYLDGQVSCVRNGRPDLGYSHWVWNPDGCTLPRFNPKMALEKLRGKKMMFIGDSLQRGQWQSFVCMIESVIPEHMKSIRRYHLNSVFTAKEYNTRVEFYWAPFLVESNSDGRIISDTSKRIVKVDSIAKHARFWVGSDILVFNTYVWWMNGGKIKSLWGSFSNRESRFEKLDGTTAYHIGLKTWADWVDSTIDPNKTRVFFTTMSPTHLRSEDWGEKKGGKCYGERKPVEKKGYWGTGSDKGVMSVVGRVLADMKVPVTVLNITQMSEYRIDAHTSVYAEPYAKFTRPERTADCIHWCLPGLPDTWNRLLFARL